MRRLIAGATLLCALGLVGIASGQGSARASRSGSCVNTEAFQFTPNAPANVDPLFGARYYVDGPGINRGFAATAIADQVHANPNRFGDITYADFIARISRRHMSPGVAYRVHLLERLASQPETHKLSQSTAGGGPGAIRSQVHKILCRIHNTDPTADAVLSTYFLMHWPGHCQSIREVGREAAGFRRHIDELVRGIGNFPTTLFLETDAMDTSPCLTAAGLAGRVRMLRYAIDQVSTLPHTVVYVDGGTSDAEPASFSAHILREIGIGKIRGFFLNATHFNWTRKEIAYGEKISRLTGGAHFVVSTTANGRGPLLNPHPRTQGVEDLCNPPGRGAGPPFTTDTGFFDQGVDAFMWTSPPGKSAGDCGAGHAPPGLYDEKWALMLARNATDNIARGVSVYAARQAAARRAARAAAGAGRR